MSDCNCPPVKKSPAGVPLWVLTFADLMTLLLAFFVLLFSFSEMDKAKYKLVAGSLQDAFGVQREVKIKEPPKGVNIIATEFSAGTPDVKTPRNELRQHTTDDFMQYLRMPDPNLIKEKLEEELNRLRLALANEIDRGFVEVDIVNETIVIRILEKGSFASGSTRLIEPFQSVLSKMALTIQDRPGAIVVAGHTDSVPISTGNFRSNWELSASRAVTVVHELMQQGDIPQERFRLEGYGRTQPIDSNETSAGRARNRRVEVTLIYDKEFFYRGEGETFAVDTQTESMPHVMEKEMGEVLPDPCPDCEGLDAGV